MTDEHERCCATEPYDPERPVNHDTLQVAGKLADLSKFEKGFLGALLQDQFDTWTIHTLARLSDQAWQAISDICATADDIADTFDDFTPFDAGTAFYIIATPHELVADPATGMLDLLPAINATSMGETHATP